MATTGVGFRWLDILEKEFDKACVELDTSISVLDTEDGELTFGARQKIATLSSCFAQLTHKALTIFQHSAKLEAELVDMRADLVQARASSTGGCQDGGDGVNVTGATRARAEAAQLARENAALRETVLALHSELYGARLATKYLDKELAGRIQQLQLLGRDMRAELRDSLWAQVEAEILLQRHKTLVRVCRGVSPRPPRPPPAPRSRPRTVRVRRSPHLGLGISVTGGREHGVPILISELEAGGPAALTGDLYVGDAILAINDLDLTQACHKEAVQALQSVKGDCALCVQFIATDDDDRLSEDNYRFPLYPEDGSAFGEEPDGSGATPTAPRTPEYNNRPPSETGSGSDSESRYRTVNMAGMGSMANVGNLNNIVNMNMNTNMNSVEYVPRDYNNINNNLAILDMDDHSIKIETRLEHRPFPQMSPRRRGGYRPLSVRASPPASPPNIVRAPHHPAPPAHHSAPSAHPAPPASPPVHPAPTSQHPVPLAPHPAPPAVNAAPATVAPASPTRAVTSPGSRGASSGSPHSTPVHQRRLSSKKKRKPQDWRTKGAYRALAPDAVSSDEPLANHDHDAYDHHDDAYDHLDDKIDDNVIGTRETYPAIVSDSLPKSLSTLVKAPVPTESGLVVADVPSTQAIPANNKQEPLPTVAQSKPEPSVPKASSEVPPPAIAPYAATSVPVAALVEVDSKANRPNGETKPPRRESKAFRIGSARRVESAALNGDTRRPRARLLPGRGDPDFGTPV